MEPRVIAASCVRVQYGGFDQSQGIILCLFLPLCRVVATQCIRTVPLCLRLQRSVIFNIKAAVMLQLHQEEMKTALRWLYTIFRSRGGFSHLDSTHISGIMNAPLLADEASRIWICRSPAII